MITGDYPATALAIARQAGIEAQAGALSGAEIAALSEAALDDAVETKRVFARIRPEQKLALVEAFKRNGHIVAMTGDGVNDGPALRAAHVGVAMGQRGTDVAREAASIVLLDDRFASIVAGVRSGRRIFANLRKALIFVTAIHVPIAGLALTPILFLLPPVFYPVHVVALELIIDPICALVFEGEPAERHMMEEPPRSPAEPLFGLRQIAAGFLEGAVLLAALLGVYFVRDAGRRGRRGDARAGLRRPRHRQSGHGLRLRRRAGNRLFRQAARRLLDHRDDHDARARADRLSSCGGGTVPLRDAGTEGARPMSLRRRWSPAAGREYTMPFRRRRG